MNEQDQAYKVQYCIPSFFFFSQEHKEKRLFQSIFKARHNA